MNSDDFMKKARKRQRNFMLKSFLVACGFWALIVFGVMYLIDSNGGVKQILIDTGKAVKEIKREIDKS